MKIVVNPEYLPATDFIASLPEQFGKGGDLIYKGRNQIKVFSIKEMKVTVKSFQVPHLINRIAYGFFRPSKARRSYEHALTLIKKGIRTPQPVAYLENRNCGLLRDSYYACLFQESTGMMREFRWGKLEGREELLRSFARFTAFIHEQDVLHIDYSPGNILYTQTGGGYEFTLLDINRMKFGKVDRETGCENLRRLWGSDEMITFIAREYARERNFDPETCVKLVLMHHDRFWKRFSKRHPEECAYET